jgi:serine/threonine protein kinase
MGFLLKIGETFAGGRVEKEVGESSSSEVYLVSHPGRGHLAIKVFKRIEQDPDQLKPLLDKARIQQQFRHKNIVRIYDAGTNEHHLGDLGCIAMEYFSGGSLATLLDSRRANQGKRLSARKTVEIIEQICNGLSAFHGAGHVHGDIKPENILVDLVNKRTDEVRYCVADFGLGKAGDPTTEFYQPPERFREERTDSFASDVWAVGVICYQLLTLEFPFRVKEFLPQGRDPFDEGLKPASGINRSVNPSLDEIIAKALCADPDQRYQTATELLAALGQWRHSLPGTERYR